MPEARPKNILTGLKEQGYLGPFLPKSIEEVMRRMCRESGVSEKEVISGSQRRVVSEVRARISCSLNREIGISMAEIARRLGVGTSAIAMAIRRKYCGSEQY